MITWWLLHPVADSDLGVPSDKSGTNWDALRDHRVAVLGQTLDPRDIRRRLLYLDWDGARVTGNVSPLGFATGSIAADVPVRLLLVTTHQTRTTASAIENALRRAPSAYGREFASVTVVESAQLAELDVVAVVAPALPSASRQDREADQAQITWGSGSTQLVLGMLEAVIAAGLPWRLATVSPNPPAVPHQVVDPMAKYELDPVVPLLRRYHYHEQLAAAVINNEIRVTERQRDALIAEAHQWEQAHSRPDAESLRLVLAGALVRADATSAFAVRRYVVARYQELRNAEDPALLDLVAWAQKDQKLQLGHILRKVRAQPDPNDPQVRELRRSRASTSGLWLREEHATVDLLNDAGKASSHQFAAPNPEVRRALREHLATLSPPAATSSEVGEIPGGGLVPAMTAWYVSVVGEGRLPRQDVLQEVVNGGADEAIARYFGAALGDVELRFLLLGTDDSTAVRAAALAKEFASADRITGASHATIPGPARAAEFDTDAAYRLLCAEFAPIRDEVGAIVCVPTGSKQLVLPVLLAGYRLAMEQGVPFYLRELTGSGMHRLPLRFGYSRVLLDVVSHALDVLELDVAARLFDACGAGHDLAERTRSLSAAMRCVRPTSANPWPRELPSDWATPAPSVGLIAERLEVWAELARSHADTTQAIRAVCGAKTVIELGVRHGYANYTGDRAWTAYCQEIDQVRARPNDQHRTDATALRAVNKVRNELPINHGDDLASPAALEELVGQALGNGTSGNPATVAELLHSAVNAARRWPSFGTVSTSNRPNLRDLLHELRREVSDLRDREHSG